jgi:hypothetical protein
MRRGRRRTWRKLHLGVDEETREIVAVELTTSGVHDGPRLPAVLDQVEGDVGQVSGDKAYDSGRCYEAILARGTVPTVPPRRNARPSSAKDRFKALVGIKLSARRLERQQVEAAVKCRVLNRMGSLGLPRSERVLQG